MTGLLEVAPARLQRSRRRGYRLPPDAVYVGRPSIWGNPWRVGDVIDSPFVWHLPSWNVGLQDGDGCTRVDAALAVDLFRSWIGDVLTSSRRYLGELRGKDLVCWCPLGQPCHADVLLELANPSMPPLTTAGPEAAPTARDP